MGDFEAVQKKLTVLSAATAIGKILKSVPKSTATGQSLSNELNESLKHILKSDDPKVCQLATETVIHLAGKNVQELPQLLAMLVRLLPNSRPFQFTAISNGIFDLLLMDLRERSATLAPNQRYVCQYEDGGPSHPLILVEGQREKSSLQFFVLRLVKMLALKEEPVRRNMVEFLRPVLLHLFVRLPTFAEYRRLWKALVQLATEDHQALEVFFDILAWRSSKTEEQVVFSVTLAMDALEVIPKEDRFLEMRLELCLYLMALMKAYTDHNHNLTDVLETIQGVLEDGVGKGFIPVAETVLMMSAELLPELTPSYVQTLLKLYHSILPYCGKLSRWICFEAAIQLLGQPNPMANHIPECQFIVNNVLFSRPMETRTDVPCGNCNRITYYHPSIAKWTTIARWWTTSNDQLDAFLNASTDNLRFAKAINLVHRALLLSNDITEAVWGDNFRTLTMLMNADNKMTAIALVPLLYCIVNHIQPNRRLRLLQTLASMGKQDQVMSILRALIKDTDQTVQLDLYLRLWKAAPRTYPFLYDLLKDSGRTNRDDSWELTIARAFAIREICVIEPQQHGADLVHLFSEFLNHPDDENYETAVCLSLNAISSLCENNVVNIMSTWKVLAAKFTAEKRPRVVRSLCHFFSKVPLVKVTTTEQENFADEVIQMLWHFITDFDDRTIICAAFDVLQLFDPESMTLRQMPEIFRQGFDLPEENEDEITVRGNVPPGCWIQVIQNTNYCATEAAGDLVGSYIAREMDNYRSGVYQRPEGRLDPSNLKYLPRQSILSVIVNHLVAQSTKLKETEQNELLLLELLRVIAKKYAKPIPPVNWIFLQEYLHHSFEMKEHCLQIAMRQMEHSGSAKRLVESYLCQLNESTVLDDEILKVFSHIKEITESVEHDTYKQFVHLSLGCLTERYEDKRLSDSSPLLQAFDVMKPALTEQFQNQENFDYLCVTLANYFNRFDAESSVFQKYAEALSLLPENYLTPLLKPSTWFERENAPKLRKAIRLQLSLVTLNPTAKQLHFYGLYDITTVIAKSEDTKLVQYFLVALLGFVHPLGNDTGLISFVAHLIAHIQQTMTDQAYATSLEMQRTSHALLDVLMAVAIGLSGYGSLHGAENVAQRSELRLALFPPALEAVCKENIWRDLEIKIFEFLHQLYGVKHLPVAYRVCFKNALICCKGQPYLHQQSLLRLKFVSMRDV